MSGNKDFNILASTFITSILLLSWILSGYAAEKKADTNDYSDVTDFAEMAQKIFSKKIRNATITNTIDANNVTTRNKTIIKPLEYIECIKNSDCGVNGTYVTKNFKCLENDVYRQYIQFRCEKPNTTDSRCVGTQRNEFIQTCGMEEKCVEGDSFCAYEGGVEYMKMSYIEKGSNSIYVSNDAEAQYKDYRLKAIFIISEGSKPRGVTIDIKRIDGSEDWIYIFYERGTTIDNLTIGIEDMQKTRNKIDANLWIRENK